MIGQSLEQVRKDLRLMPTPALMQYKQNPGKQAIDGVPLDMLAGLELSRRAELQQSQIAQMAPNAQMPTVVDQQAMGLMGMAQQPAVNPAMPGQPPQFAAQQAPQPQAPAAPQGAPEAAPQQMAQAPQPQGMQMPMQPTQQQPKKMAVGGLASLGDMQDARDQGMAPPGMYPAGQPVMRLARGGIVAFQNNSDQPVDANMPSTDTRSQFRRDVGSVIDRLTPTEEEQRFQRFLQERRRQGAPIQYLLSPAEEYQRNKAVREFINDNPQAFSTPEARQRFMADPQAFISGFGKTTPPAADAGTAASGAPSAPGAAGPVKPEDITVTQGGGGGGLDINKLIAQFGGRGGGGFDSKKIQEMIDKAMAPTPNETAYQTLVTSEMERIRNRPSPEVSEAERQRIIKEQFDQNQALSKPYYERMQQMLGQEREDIKARREEAASNARLRLGLGLLGSRAPTLGEGLKEAGVPALEVMERADELTAQARAKNRQAEMDLVKSRMADERGDREAAQRYFDSFQRNRREAETYEIQRANMLINAQKGVVDIEGKRERAGMGLQLGLERAAAQAENAGLRQQLGLMGLAARLQGQGPKMPTVGEVATLERLADAKIAPGTPEFMQYVGKLYKGGATQLKADLENKRVQPGDPGFQSIVQQARKNFMNDVLGRTSRAQGTTSYNQAASDLLGQ